MVTEKWNTFENTIVSTLQTVNAVAVEWVGGGRGRKALYRECAGRSDYLL